MEGKEVPPPPPPHKPTQQEKVKVKERKDILKHIEHQLEEIEREKKDR